MSGGHFQGNQYRIQSIIDEIEDIILKNDAPELDSYGYRIGYGYPPEIIEKFEEGLEYLTKAQIYAQRIDWLVSGDDGEETFLKRLKHDLKGAE